MSDWPGCNCISGALLGHGITWNAWIKPRRLLMDPCQKAPSLKKETLLFLQYLIPVYSDLLFACVLIIRVCVGVTYVHVASKLRSCGFLFCFLFVAPATVLSCPLRRSVYPSDQPDPLMLVVYDPISPLRNGRPLLHSMCSCRAVVCGVCVCFFFFELF